MATDQTHGAQELNDSNFRSTLEGKPIAIVDLYASWCGSCRLFAPTYEQIARSHPEIAFYKIDGDANPNCRSDLTISNLPYFAAYRNGRFIEGISTTSEELLEKFIQDVRSRA